MSPVRLSCRSISFLNMVSNLCTPGNSAGGEVEADDADENTLSCEDPMKVLGESIQDGLDKDERCRVRPNF